MSFFSSCVKSRSEGIHNSKNSVLHVGDIGDIYWALVNGLHKIHRVVFLTEYLEDYCGKTLYHGGPWLRLKLTRRDYPSNFKCNTSVVFSDTKSGQPARLMVVVHKLETKCPGDRLTLVDGNTSLPLRG